MAMELLRSETVELKITRPRKTKFGDYRFPKKDNPRHRISVNGNLNKFAFLITLIHEMAHLKAFKNFGRKIKPHGREWQRIFMELAQPFLDANIFPNELSLKLKKSLRKGAASSCTDLELFRELQKFNPDHEQKTTVEDLETGAVFRLNQKKIFKKGPKARTRFRCLNLENGREYMVHALAEVEQIEPHSLCV